MDVYTLTSNHRRRSGMQISPLMSRENTMYLTDFSTFRQEDKLSFSKIIFIQVHRVVLSEEKECRLLFMTLEMREKWVVGVYQYININVFFAMNKRVEHALLNDCLLIWWKVEVRNDFEFVFFQPIISSSVCFPIFPLV